MPAEEEHAMKVVTGEACDPLESLFEEDAINVKQDESAIKASTQRLFELYELSSSDTKEMN